MLHSMVADRLTKKFFSIIHSTLFLACQPLSQRIGIDLHFGKAEFPKETATIRQENKQNVHKRIRMLSCEGSKVNGASRRLRSRKTLNARLRNLDFTLHASGSQLG